MGREQFFEAQKGSVECCEVRRDSLVLPCVSPLIILIERTSRYAVYTQTHLLLFSLIHVKQVHSSLRPQKSNQTNIMPNTFVMCIDETLASEEAFKHVVPLIHPGDKLILLHVMEPIITQPIIAFPPLQVFSLSRQR